MKEHLPSDTTPTLRSASLTNMIQTQMRMHMSVKTAECCSASNVPCCALSGSDDTVRRPAQLHGHLCCCWHQLHHNCQQPPGRLWLGGASFHAQDTCANWHRIWWCREHGASCPEAHGAASRNSRWHPCASRVLWVLSRQTLEPTPCALSPLWCRPSDSQTLLPQSRWSSMSAGAGPMARCTWMAAHVGLVQTRRTRHPTNATRPPQQRRVRPPPYQPASGIGLTSQMRSSTRWLRPLGRTRKRIRLHSLCATW